jgi:hypothetical protein
MVLIFQQNVYTLWPQLFVNLYESLLTMRHIAPVRAFRLYEAPHRYTRGRRR